MTSYVKAFESYRIIDIYTDRDIHTYATEIIHHTTSRVVQNKPRRTTDPCSLVRTAYMHWAQLKYTIHTGHF